MTLLEQAERLLNDGLGGEEIEIYLSSGTETEVRAYQGDVEDLTSASSAGIGVRILIDGPAGARVGTAWAGSLDEHAVRAAIRDARDNVQFATEDEFVAFARPDGVAAPALTLTDDGVTSTPIDEKIALAIELERRVRAPTRASVRWIRRTTRTTWPNRHSSPRRVFERATRERAPICRWRRSQPTARTIRRGGASVPDARRAS